MKEVKYKAGDKVRVLCLDKMSKRTMRRLVGNVYEVTLHYDDTVEIVERNIKGEMFDNYWAFYIDSVGPEVPIGTQLEFDFMSEPVAPTREQE